jgi:modulator of FtsH protease HflC
MQSERAREAAEYRAKGSEPRERSPPQPTAMSSYFVATRSAKLIEGDAERNRIFAEAYGRTRISLPSIARCRPMKLD